MIMSQSREVGVVEGREGEGGVGRGGGEGVVEGKGGVGRGGGGEEKGRGGSLPTHIHQTRRPVGVVSSHRCHRGSC